MGSGFCKSTPHARGSTHTPPCRRKPENVYPACAGIHPGIEGCKLRGWCLPRMRGDPPLEANETIYDALSTPHARGSTRPTVVWTAAVCVYPACAGIHPTRGARRLRPTRLPRMRGDPPALKRHKAKVRTSTPHARGSTAFIMIPRKNGKVYPACAGIHLRGKPRTPKTAGLPRMRGDPPVSALTFSE